MKPEKKSAWMIYGANGYTGRLVAREAKRQRLRPVLAGRSEALIKTLANELRLPWRVFGLDDPAAAARALADVAVLANCAGPFSATSKPMIEACLASKTHYLDITGEIAVFVNAQRHGTAAKRVGIVLCPGVGFDVIPTDCVAAVLKEALPDASHLALGFDAPMSLSPGTSKTSIEGLKFGGLIRKDGEIIEVPLAHHTRRIDFGAGDRFAATIPWGDVATAYFSTGIPNIEVFVPVSPAVAAGMRGMSWLRPLLTLPPVQVLLKGLAQITAGGGPSQRDLNEGTTYVWGEVRNGAGDVRAARLTTANGYRLTCHGVLLAVRTLLQHTRPGGYYTASQLMGPRCVERLPGSSRIKIQ
jgi:short subunit dehydrogenase-like uncharacterized protein